MLLHSAFIITICKFIELPCKQNRTPDYFRDFLRIPTMLKMHFRRMKAFFFFKILCHYIIFSNFSNSKFFFLIFAKKTSNKRWMDIFQEKVPFDTHSRKILPHVAILKKIRSLKKKHKFCSKKERNFVSTTYLRSLTVSVAFYSKIATSYH